MSYERTAGERAHARLRRLFLVSVCLVSGVGCGRGGPKLHTVTMRLVRFEPDSLVIAKGDTVEWVNHDIVPHTATATNGAWDSKTLLPGASWRTVLATPGPQPYSCLLHITMKGRIDVR
jgi:plastocyanin